MKPDRACTVESLEPRRLYSASPAVEVGPANDDSVVITLPTEPVSVGISNAAVAQWIVGRDWDRFGHDMTFSDTDPELQAYFDAKGLAIQFRGYLGNKAVFSVDAPLSKAELTAALSDLDGFQSVDENFVYPPLEPPGFNDPRSRTGEIVLASPSDLSLTSVAADASTVSAGGVLTVQFSHTATGLFNWSTINQTYARVSFALSPDTAIGNADDVPLGGYMVSLWSFGVPITTDLRLPDDLAPGTYHLVATIDADGTVAESDETNNTFVGTTVDVTPAAPRDLTLVNVSLGYNAPTTYAPGSTIRPFAPARIAGAFARGVNIAYALSLDDVAGNEDDIPLGVAGGWADSNLHYSGEFAPMILTPAFTIPASVRPGTYHLVATVDPDNQVAESDEFNNSAVGPTITIESDSTPTDPTPANPIPAEPVTPPAPTPPAVRAGSNSAVTVTLSNPSAKHRKANHTVTLYLSPDATLNRDDLRFSRQTITTPLKPGQSKTQLITYKLPAATSLGTRYVIAVTDTGATTATPITVVAPRLAAHITAATPAPQPNRSRVTVEVTNTGTARASGASVLRLFDADDHLLATIRRTFTLPAGTSTSLKLTLRRSASYSVTID